MSMFMSGVVQQTSSIYNRHLGHRLFSHLRKCQSLQVLIERQSPTVTFKTFLPHGQRGSRLDRSPVKETSEQQEV